MSDPPSEPGSGSRPVVTLFESYGSGADEIGPALAEALGVRFYEQAFSSEQLEEPPEPEDEGMLSRFLNAIGSSYIGIEGPAVAMAQKDQHEMVLENNRLVRQEASGGAVILGRNGAFILATWPGALHVRLDAPLDYRIDRAARISGIERERAARRQKREDQIRADMSLQLYGWDPREPSRYDLVVNTATLHRDDVVDLLVHAYRAKTRRARHAQQPGHHHPQTSPLDR